jgi:hypothetical protein
MVNVSALPARVEAQSSESPPSIRVTAHAAEHVAPDQA